MVNTVPENGGSFHGELLVIMVTEFCLLKLFFLGTTLICGSFIKFYLYSSLIRR